MKRICLLLILCLSMMMSLKSNASSNYHAFESMTVTSGTLLEDFTKDDYDTYYPKVDRRKFMGWRVHEVHKNIKVSYISDTLFSYYNNGTTAIDYRYKMDRMTQTKLHLSATGTIGIQATRMDKTFKNNLNGSLKLSSDYQTSTQEKESIDVFLKVDPGTQVDLYIYGEGKITNGVAARYVFWFRADRGGYEVFLITTQYQRLEKIKI